MYTRIYIYVYVLLRKEEKKLLYEIFLILPTQINFFL